MTEAALPSSAGSASTPADHPSRASAISSGALALALAAGLYALSRQNYLLFHGLAELASVALGVAVYMLAWNGRAFVDNAGLIFLGIAAPCIGLVDLLHALAYKGMGVFDPGWGANLPTQLWIAGRALEAVSRLLFPLLVGARLRPARTLALWVGCTALPLAAIFAWPVFPACYVEGVGLTPFKVGAEYAICAVLLAGLGALHRRRRALDPAVYRPLRLALAVAVLAELAFTLYVDLYGLANFLGHALRILKAGFEYVALIGAGLTRPYAVLFRELTQKEEASRRDLEDLRRTEAALRESEQRFATSFRSNPAWLTIVHLETGRVLEVNEAWSALMGHARHEAVGRTVAELGIYDEATWGRIVEEVRAKRTVRNVEVVARTRTGDRRVLLVSREAIEVGGEPFLLAMGLDITERKRTEEALRESLAEKTALLQEVHHRVKNNLQVVASLLSLQAKRSRHREAVGVLQDTQARVQSMALLHELLYRSGNLARVNIATHVEEVCRHLTRASGESAGRVVLEQRIASVHLPMEHAVPLGLIVTELVSNALKHAFPGGRTGRVAVGLQPAGGDRLALSVRDDGAGLPPGVRSGDSPTLGLQLVEALAAQLGGSLTVGRANGGGAAFDLVFPTPGGVCSEGKS